MEVKLAGSALEIAYCSRIILQLRPHIAESELIPRVEAQQRQGFQLAYLADAGEVVAMAGFRIMEILATGRTLYVDDLVTDERQRSRCYGKVLLDWLQTYARDQGCETFSLDSGTFRHEAHAFYFREGMRVTSFHFTKKLK